MRRNPRAFRLTATVAVAALLWDAGLPFAAMAQPAPPPLPPSQGQGQSQPDQNQADPPARVGRIASITGAVSFHNQGDTQWTTASVNYPVSSGNAFWTQPSAETQLEVSDSRITLASGTEFDIYALDANGLQGVSVQGEIYLYLRDLAPNEAWSVQTPRGLVHLGGAGRYEIVVGTTGQPTLVTVVDGSAQIESPGVSLQIAANQTATVTGTDSFQGSVGPALRDAFLTQRLNAERPPPAPAGVPAQVAVMPGGSDLYRQGSWAPAPEYGQVWYPPVAPGWVPYRQGHWAYVAPWGWTWIDDASWGFAPFHYGRWVQIGGRWAWTPGVAAVAQPPVYAPALVAFIGIGAGVALGAALASGSIGWVPLGPREEYHPWYHASNNYIRQVNVSHVTNITNVTRNVTINNYVNRGAATSVPASAMMASRPVQAVARPMTAQEFARARPIVGQQPLRPTAATAGVTPVVARQLNLAPAAQRRPAPGPVVQAPGPMVQAPGPVVHAPGPVVQAPGPAVQAPAPGPAGVAFSRPALTPARGRPEPAPAGRPEPANAGVQHPPGAMPNPAVPNAAEPNHPGSPAPGARPLPAVAPNIAQPNRPNVPVPGARPEPGVVPNTAQPNRPATAAPGFRPAGEPPAVHQTAPFHPAPAVTAPHAAPAMVPHPVAPAPQPRFTAPPVAAPRPPEARPAAPPPRPEPAARPAPPPAPHPAPAAAARLAPREHEKKPGEH
jgi:hypothetical protein